MSIVKPLYGHVSPETAFVVDDYPYGFRLRCKIRYWIEKKPKHGFRLMSQTTNPKKAGEVWNKPKASTYYSAGGALYLDEMGHVQWGAIHIHSDVKDVLEFVKNFPSADLSEIRAEDHIRILQRGLKDGRAPYIGELTPEMRERYEAEIEQWQEVARYVKGEVEKAD